MADNTNTGGYTQETDSSAKTDSVAQSVQNNGNSEISRLHLTDLLDTSLLQNPQQKHFSC